MCSLSNVCKNVSLSERAERSVVTLLLLHSIFSQVSLHGKGKLARAWTSSVLVTGRPWSTASPRASPSQGSRLRRTSPPSWGGRSAGWRVWGSWSWEPLTSSPGDSSTGRNTGRTDTLCGRSTSPSGRNARRLRATRCAHSSTWAATAWTPCRSSVWRTRAMLTCTNVSARTTFLPLSTTVTALLCLWWMIVINLV